jgi:hypothetical protein
MLRQMLALGAVVIAAGCAATPPPLGPAEIAATRQDDAKRLCAAGTDASPGCEAGWVAAFQQASPVGVVSRQRIADLEEGLRACTAAGWQPASGEQYACAGQHARRLSETREQNRAARAAFGAALGDGLSAYGASLGAQQPAPVRMQTTCYPSGRSVVCN